MASYLLENNSKVMCPHIYNYKYRQTKNLMHVKCGADITPTDITPTAPLGYRVSQIL